MPMAEKETADKSNSSDVKDFSPSCIVDHQNNNDSQPSFVDFTGGLKTAVPDNHTLDGHGHLLQSHKLMMRDHDVSSKHEKMTSNPAK